MKKTVEEWIKELPEPYKSQALENAKNQECLQRPLQSNTLSLGLWDFFIWENTPQGDKYWHNVFLLLRKQKK